MPRRNDKHNNTALWFETYLDKIMFTLLPCHCMCSRAPLYINIMNSVGRLSLNFNLSNDRSHASAFHCIHWLWVTFFRVQSMLKDCSEFVQAVDANSLFGKFRCVFFVTHMSFETMR